MTLELFGIPLGTPFQGGTLVVALLAAGLIVRTYILGMPDRGRVKNEAKVIADAELASRYKAWREEVHGLRNELAAAQGEIKHAADWRAENKAKLSQVLFILKLVTTELLRVRPDSEVVKQANDLLGQVTGEDESIASTLTVAAAKATVVAAKDTLDEAKKDADSTGKGG